MRRKRKKKKRMRRTMTMMMKKLPVVVVGGGANKRAPMMTMGMLKMTMTLTKYSKSFVLGVLDKANSA